MKKLSIFEPQIEKNYAYKKHVVNVLSMTTIYENEGGVVLLQ